MMSSLTSSEKQTHESKKDVHKNYSWDGVKTDCLKETSPMSTQLQQKHLKHTSNNRSIEDIAYRTVEHRRSIDDSNLFLIKTVIVWILICLPGNIFALTIFCKHSETTSSNEQPVELTSNLSSKENSNSQIGTLRPVEYVDNRSSMSQNSTKTATDFDAFEYKDELHEDNQQLTIEVTHCYEYLEASLESTRSRLRFWIEGVLIFAIGLLGFIGNVITIVVLRGYRKNRNFHILIICLTIADSILILDSVWQKSIVQHFMSPPEWYNKTFPYIWHPLKGMSLSATIFMVIAVSAERFRAVCYPMSRHHSPSKFVIFVVTISIMTKLPRFFQFELKDDGSDYKISEMMGDPIYIRFTSYWDDIVVTGFIPLLLLMYFNLKLYLKIRSSRHMQNIRHFGRQSTRQSTQTAHSGRQTSGKRNIVLRETNNSKEIFSSPALSEIDHEKLEKELVSNQSVQIEDHQQKSIFTSQKNANIPLYVLDYNVERSRHVRQNSKQSRRLLDRSFTTINATNKANSNHFVAKAKFHGHNKCTTDIGNMSNTLEQNDKRLDSNHSEKKVDQTFSPGSSTIIRNQQMNMGLITTNGNQNSKTIPQISNGRRSFEESKDGSNNGSIRKKFSTGKSTLILVVIVVFFVITHSNRLALKVYMSVFPQLNTKENFTACLKQGRYHAPFALYVLQHLSNMFIVLNSSVNFIIYCCVAKGFRERAMKIFWRRVSRRQQHNQSSFV